MRDQDFRRLTADQKAAYAGVPDEAIAEQPAVQAAMREEQRTKQAAADAVRDVDELGQRVTTVASSIDEAEIEIAEVISQRDRIVVAVALADAVADKSDKQLHARLLDLERRRDVCMRARELLTAQRDSLQARARRAGESAADASYALEQAQDAARLRLAGIVR